MPASQFKIEPFKHPLKMDPSYGGEPAMALVMPHTPDLQSSCMQLTEGSCACVHAEKTWKVLEDAIHEINNHNASGLSFEELYRCVVACWCTSFFLCFRGGKYVM